MKAGSKRPASRNDYRVNLRQQTITPARGRDRRLSNALDNRAEKIVWSAPNLKVQSCGIKSPQDNNTIPYQRGPAAIARQILKDTRGKVACDTQKAMQFIAAFYEAYPEVRAYINMCKNSVVSPGWIANPFGRRRRFMLHDSEAALAAQQRECVNFPIQSTVADLLNISVQNFYCWRQAYPSLGRYKILLGIHDAVILEVPVDQVELVTDRVIPECMTAGSVTPAWRPVPAWRPTVPFSLETDLTVMLRWGEKASCDELRERGVTDAAAQRFGKAQ